MDALDLIRESLNKLTFDVVVQRAIWIILGILMLTSLYYLIQIANKHVDEDKQIKVSTKKVFKWFLIALAVFIFYLILKTNASLRYLFNTFIASLIIAYVLNPAVRRLEKRKYMNRTRAIAAIYLIVLVILVIFSLTILPKTVQEFKKLINNLPSYVNQAQQLVNDLSVKIAGKELFDIKTVDWGEFIQNMIQTARDNMGGVLSGVKKTVSKTLMIVLIPLFVFYLLNDKEIFVEKAKALIPEKRKEKTLQVLSKIDKQVGNYVKGKLLSCLALGIMISIFLTIAGVDFAFVIGIISMFADIIPYIGPLVGFIPAFIFAIIDSPAKALAVIIIFPVANWLQNNIIMPKIFADTLGMHPFTVLIAILVGGFLFGFVGMIFALPIVIIGQVVYNEYKDYRKNKIKEESRIENDRK